MPEAMDQDGADKSGGRPARGMRLLIGLLVSIALPSAIYAFYVIGQLAHIREHNLRELENTAQEVSQLVDNTRNTVANLATQARYACSFFQRQIRTALDSPNKCEEVQDAAKRGLSATDLHLDTSKGNLDILGVLADPNNAAGTRQQTENAIELRIRILVDALLKEVPFGSVFDRLMIVDDKGMLVGSAITPQRNSPMLPPGVAPTGHPSPPLRVLDLAQLKFIDSTKDDKITFDAFAASTLVQPVALAGVHYTLMCQPWKIGGVGKDRHDEAWRVCGLIDGQRALRQALDVAPQFIFLLVGLFTLAILSWPILKVLSIAPRERIRFGDMFLMLLATLALVMVISVGIADVSSYAQLREHSRTRLQNLAFDIETHLRIELGAMSRELDSYDSAIARTLASSNWSGFKAGEEPRIGCLLQGPDAISTGSGCQRAADLEQSLRSPQYYRYFDNVYWMRPCDGLQIIKGTVYRENTPAVTTAGRDYFEAVKRDRLWAARVGGTEGRERPATFFVDTASSITTGEFFAALSIKSSVELPPPKKLLNCTEEEARRVAAAITGRLESFDYPILAPGVGFAVINVSGRVLFHSDERRAVYETLLDDEGLADRLRAALTAQSDVAFHAHYQTSPHQLYVHPLHDIPWAIVTFADDEILRTHHIEMLVKTAVLVTLYLLLAVVGTLIYVLAHGKAPPLWMWPRREKKYRALYCSTVWTLSAQLILSLLAVDLLRGEVLVLASALLPVPCVLTIAVAARQARRLGAPPQAGVTPETHVRSVLGKFGRSSALLLALAFALLVGLLLLMECCYPVTAAQMSLGIETVALAVLFVIVVAGGGLGGRIKARLDSSRTVQLASLVRWWRDPIRPHIVASIIVWLVLGALPAYGFYKFALANEMTSIAMNEQAFLGRALGWHACEVQEQYRNIPTAGTTSPQMDMSGVEHRWLYPVALLSRDVRLTTDRPGYGTISDRTVGRPFWHYIANVAPIYNETTAFSRYVDPAAVWFRAAPKGARTTRDPALRPMLVYQLGGEGTCDHSVSYLASRPRMLEPHFGWVGALVSLGFMALLFAWTSFAARKLFFGDIEAEARDPMQDDRELPFVVSPGNLDLPADSAWIERELAYVFDPNMSLSKEVLTALCEKCATRRAAAETILEQEASFYAQQWRGCSRDEQLLLIQLVQEGFANPRQDEAVRMLLARGVLLRDPVLRPMNSSFALFVQKQTQPADIEHLEAVETGMRWSLVRNALIAMGLLILIFLSVTQRDVVDVWAAYLATAAAGAGGVSKLLSMIGRSGPQKAG